MKSVITIRCDNDSIHSFVTFDCITQIWNLSILCGSSLVWSGHSVNVPGLLTLFENSAEHLSSSLSGVSQMKISDFLHKMIVTPPRNQALLDCGCGVHYHG